MANEELTPAEQLLASDTSSRGRNPLFPWQPKGDAEPDPQITVEGIDLVYSNDPPKTAGGASPGVRTYLGKFGPDQ